jgi:hypothetical protein
VSQFTEQELHDLERSSYFLMAGACGALLAVVAYGLYRIIFG